MLLEILIWAILDHFVGSPHFQFLGHDMDVSDYDGRTPLHLAAAEVKYQQSAYY